MLVHVLSHVTTMTELQLTVHSHVWKGVSALRGRWSLMECVSILQNVLVHSSTLLVMCLSISSNVSRVIFSMQSV